VHRLARQNGTASRAGPTKVPTQPVETLAASQRHTGDREKKPPGPWLCGKGIRADWPFEEIPVARLPSWRPSGAWRRERIGLEVSKRR
jgi:hypothetical protein